MDEEASNEWEELEEARDLLDELVRQEEGELSPDEDEWPQDLEWVQYYYESGGFWYEGDK